MKKILCLLSITFLILQSCSDNDTSIPERINVLDSDFTLKYEIKFSYPTKGSNIIRYWTEDVNQNKQIEVEEDIPSGTVTWTKIIHAKLKVRPYTMGFEDRTLIHLSSGGGSAISGIYINDQPISHKTSPIANAYWAIPIELVIRSSAIYF